MVIFKMKRSKSILMIFLLSVVGCSKHLLDDFIPPHAEHVSYEGPHQVNFEIVTKLSPDMVLEGVNQRLVRNGWEKEKRSPDESINIVGYLPFVDELGVKAFVAFSNVQKWINKNNGVLIYAAAYVEGDEEKKGAKRLRIHVTMTSNEDQPAVLSPNK